MANAQAVQDAVSAVKAQASPEQEVAEVEVSTPEIEIEDTTQVIETDESPAIDAPNSWSKTEKESFSTLPRDIQVSLALRERERDLNIRKGQDETALQRKELDKEREGVNQQKVELSDRLKSGSRKPSTDMLDPEHESFDSDAYHLANSKYEKGLEEAKKLDDDLSLEDAEKRKIWQENEIKVYQEVLPEFVDNEKGPALRQKLAEHAVKVQGITMEQAAQAFPTTPANQMIILYESMKYREAVARGKAAKQTPKPKSLSGGSSNPQPAQKADLKSAIAKFNKDLSPASAGALLGLNKG